MESDFNQRVLTVEVSDGVMSDDVIADYVIVKKSEKGSSTSVSTFIGLTRDGF